MLAVDEVDGNPADSVRPRRVRTSAQFEVVPLAELAQSEAQFGTALRADPSWFGILRPLDADRSAKSISRDVASLLEALQTPELMAPGHGLLTDPAHSRGLMRLLLDGVVEVEAEGGFRSGAAALPHLRSWGWLPELAAEGLSLRAIEYGARLTTDDRIWLSGRLYGFNRWPLSARDHGVLSRRGIDDWLGLKPEALRRISRTWMSSDTAGPWRRFHGRTAPLGAATHKLYVSVGMDDVATALAASIDVFSRTKTPGFKVAGAIDEIARPDRLVAYFVDHESLFETAAVLDSALGGCSRQGVPFTAPIGTSGLLSWGMDPPPDPSRLPWQGPSWRRWVTDLLAGAILDAKSEGPAAAGAISLARVAIEGIDPGTWTPAENFWQGAT